MSKDKNPKNPKVTSLNQVQNSSCGYLLPKLTEEIVAKDKYKWKDTPKAMLRNMRRVGDCTNEETDDGLGDDEDENPLHLTKYERFLLRYNYCIHNSVDTAYITPLSNEVIDRIMTEYNDLIQCILGQVKNDYIVSMKKTTIDFVLDESSPTPGRVYSLPIKLGQFPESWRFGFKKNRSRLRLLLHCTNPCLAHIHMLWQKSYRDFMLINTKAFTKLDSALELPDYHLMCLDNFSINIRKLLDEWYCQVLNIICEANANKLVPSREQTLRKKHFYSCVDTLMALQLQQLIINSLSSYTKMLSEPHSSVSDCSLPGFIVRFICDKTSIGLEPTWKDFEVVIIYMLDIILKAAKIFPKVEGLLYNSGLEKNKLVIEDFLRLTIFDDFVEECKQKVLDMLERERLSVLEHAEIFDEYQSVITEQFIHLFVHPSFIFSLTIELKADKEIAHFLSRDNLTFDMIGEEVLRYEKICHKVSAAVPPVIFSGMFEIHCEVLTRNLVKRTEGLIGLLLNEMISSHNRANKMSDTVVELMELIDYVSVVKEKLAVELQDKLQASHIQLLFLLDHGIITVDDMKLNVETFLWKNKLELSLSQCQQVIEKTKKELQAAIMTKRTNLKNRLEMLEYEIGQLKFIENLDRFNTYWETVSKLNLATQEINNEIEALWIEETAYGWPNTPMPLKTQVINNLKPYLQFFELIDGFNKKQE
ncbi:hypothetical protein HELRODRAFT_165224 [Helobdella robusta]|uniref:Uncharacterized protein n=1 Tax=Helobdella robusta TaxID=6412 RepID=T1EWG4_HELRO|nr:hypothetical protein HELRODRAFT_165224 [Helobdella robusta]ESN93065.1 hypothetical protein HELRODRAFT_165224 [Helobdella robusta]